MGQVLHGSATTTHAVRAAIQRSQASIATLSRTYGVNPKTVAKWRQRATVGDAAMGPKEPRSTVLSPEEEALVVAFRRYTLLPLDDCLYALQATVPHLTRSSLHRCFQRHGIGRLPKVEGATPKKAFKSYPIGFFHLDIAEVRTEEGKLHLFVAIDGQETIDPIPERDAASRPQRRPHQQARLRRAPRASHTAHRRRLPRPPDRIRALPDPHRAHRQRHAFHRSHRRRLVARRHPEDARCRRGLPLPRLRTGLRPARHRPPAHQAEPSPSRSADRVSFRDRINGLLALDGPTARSSG